MLQQRFGEADTGDINHNVQASELLGGMAHHLLHLGVVGNINRQCTHPLGVQIAKNLKGFG